MRNATLIACLALLLPGVAGAQGWPDLSKPIPATAPSAGDAAVVIAIESYFKVGAIPGARQNAEDWYRWLTKTRGIPAPRVRLLLDDEATNSAIRSAAAEAAQTVKPGATLWFVFIGHGAPSEDGKDGVLVGVDAQQSVENLYERSVRQRDVLAALGKGAQAQSVVVLDACFSGRGASGSYLVEGLQPLLPVSMATAAGMERVLVMTAGTGKQFAGPLPGAARPAFSYLLLGALRGWGDADEDGKVTADEAVRYASDALRVVLSGRQQTPEAFPAERANLVLVAIAAGKRESGPDLADLKLWLARGGGRTSGPSEATAPPVSVEPQAQVVVPPPVVAPVEASVSSGQVVRHGDLEISAVPAGQVRLTVTDPSGKKVESGSPYRAPQAAPGRWRVLAEATGHEPKQIDLEVRAGDRVRHQLSLERIQLGGLKVEGTPAGAAVSVTGVGGFSNQGGLPWSASNLRAGAYMVSVSSPGYASKTFPATVEAGRTQTITARLEPTKSADPLDPSRRKILESLLLPMATGKLAVTAAGSGGGQVEIIGPDGKSLGSMAVPCEVAGAPGEYRIVSPAETKTATVVAERTTEVVIQLPARTGRVTISSNPETIRVSVWDASKRWVHDSTGNTSFDLPEGTYQFDAGADGYVTEYREVTVTAGQEQVVWYYLEREYSFLRDQVLNPMTINLGGGLGLLPNFTGEQFLAPNVELAIRWRGMDWVEVGLFGQWMPTTIGSAPASGWAAGGSFGLHLLGDTAFTLMAELAAGGGSQSAAEGSKTVPFVHFRPTFGLRLTEDISALLAPWVGANFVDVARLSAGAQLKLAWHIEY